MWGTEENSLLGFQFWGWAKGVSLSLNIRKERPLEMLLMK